MKNHIWRPLYLAIAAVLIGLIVRLFIVPPDFGAHERGYMYGWHRKSNEQEWAAIPVKYRTAKVCIDCHRDKYDDIKDSPHGIISCENCHGPNYDHPKNPKVLEVNRSRSLCLRCHTKLPYKGTLRGSFKGINPESHYPQAECMMCHYPHNPKRPSPRLEVKR
jgi:predicted CXXCH cytochrome family protein